MKKVSFLILILFGIITVGCSSTNSKWTFTDDEYNLILNDAKEVKSNYDMYVEKESRELDYSKELEQNVELTEVARENIKSINEKYEGKLTDEETTLLADLSVSYRYIGNVFKSDDKTTIKQIDIIQSRILDLEEE